MKIKKLHMKLFILLIFITNNFLLVSQNSGANYKIPDIIPISPEAKGIGRFGDVPVGIYTGTPEISIPIYTVRAGKLSLPITLSYHATGIEVAQEATWVGLGWNLIAGGSISYIPVGSNDFSNRGFMNSGDYSSVVNYLKAETMNPPIPIPMQANEDWFVNWEGVYPGGPQPQIITSSKITSLMKGMESDVYSANFMNYSFKFIKHPENGTYFFVGSKNKCLITGGGLNGFVITGEDGTKYRFDKFELAPVPVIGSIPSSWLMTKITSVTGDTISLKYASAIITNLPALSETYTKADNVVPLIRNLSPGFQNTLYLDKIETSNEEIIFERSSDRNDLQGASKLIKLTVKDKINQADKYSYQFAYGYFSGSDVGGNYLNDGQNGYNSSFTENNKKQRLKLESLTQCKNTAVNDIYSFTYYESVPLPSKTSFAMDHWGRYNGKENLSSLISGSNRTIIPNVFPLVYGDSLMSLVDVVSLFSLKGAVRGATKDTVIASAGMLKSIQYPTKGKTVFTYEPHSCNNKKYMSAEDEALNQIIYPKATVSVYPSTFTQAPRVTSDTITLTKKTNINFTGFADYGGAYFVIEGPNTNLVYSISDPNVTGGHTSQWDRNITLEPGTYTFRCSTPSTDYHTQMKPLIWGQITIYTYTINYTSNPDGVIGGVRIKNIVNYDENNIIVSSKKFSYIDENGKSSGKLLIPLRNFDWEEVVSGRCEEIKDFWGSVTGVYPHTYLKNYYHLFGRNSIPLSALSSANYIGYSRIIIESFNNNTTNGKEISYFNNVPAELYFHKVPYFNVDNNGSLSKKITLKANGDIQQLEKFTYQTLSGTEQSEILNLYAEDHYEGSTDCGVAQNVALQCPLAYVGRFEIYAYPTRNYWNALTGKEITNYFPNGSVQETVEYTYNIHNFSVKSSKLDASDSFKYTDITYPPDYPNDPVLSAMVGRNQINQPVVKSEYKNIGNQQKTIIDYSLQRDSFYAPSKIKSKTGAFPIEDRVVFDKYDIHGNVTEVHLHNGIKESYFYAYNSSFPIVKAVNIDSDALNSAIQQALSATGYSTMDNLLKSISNLPSSVWTAFNINLRNSCSAGLISTYTYDPIFGMTSMTDPRGVTTYYKYDVFNRLQWIKDTNGKLMQSFDYNYKQ